MLECTCCGDSLCTERRKQHESVLTLKRARVMVADQRLIGYPSSQHCRCRFESTEALVRTCRTINNANGDGREGDLHRFLHERWFIRLSGTWCSLHAQRSFKSTSLSLINLGGLLDEVPFFYHLATTRLFLQSSHITWFGMRRPAQRPVERLLHGHCQLILNKSSENMKIRPQVPYCID